MQAELKALLEEELSVVSPDERIKLSDSEHFRLFAKLSSMEKKKIPEHLREDSVKRGCCVIRKKSH